MVQFKIAVKKCAPKLVSLEMATATSKHQAHALIQTGRPFKMKFAKSLGLKSVE
jgi:hypothetical protein